MLLARDRAKRVAATVMALTLTLTLKVLAASLCAVCAGKAAIGRAEETPIRCLSNCTILRPRRVANGLLPDGQAGSGATYKANYYPATLLPHRAAG